MFSKIKHIFTLSGVIIIPVFALTSCGPVDNVKGQNSDNAIPHNEMIKNFDNYAIACYSPQKNGETISCRTTSRYAHYTMSFMELDKLDGTPTKVVYKLRYGDKNGYSCVDHTTADPEKITAYNASDDIADVAVEIEKRDSPSLTALKDKIVAREKAIGELCYKYTLITTEDPMMTYQIKSEEFKDAKPTGKTEMLAIFSNGTKVRMAK